FSLPEEEYDIILYVDKDMNIKDENALKKIYKNIIIKHFNYKNETLEKSAILKTFTNMSYARFEALSLLNEYKQVIYFDTDILIQKDIISLTKMNEKNIYGFINKDMTLEIQFINKHLIKNYDTNKYNLNTYEINSGVIVFNNNIHNPEEIKEWCYIKRGEWEAADQPILNLALQEFNISFEDFTESYNKVYPCNNYTNYHILHSITSEKFWELKNPNEWNENNNQWISLGGTNYYKTKYKRKKDMIYNITWLIPFKKLRYYIKNKLNDIFNIRYGG
ncbi:glycosyltransferase, partial [Brachyspira intermedia]